MPHLLMAGATGQGKSVGLNAVLLHFCTKNIQLKVKFVLVDPKSRAYTFNKIEKTLFKNFQIWMTQSLLIMLKWSIH
jgi:predicted GTPase